jgi:rhodanese-related sulfurtransferase
MRHLSVEGLAEFLGLHPHAKVLDVRLAHEREAGHLPGDLHVPWYTPDWEPNPGFLDQVLQHSSPEDYVLVICRDGHHSCEAATLLETAGFKHVYNLLGGYEDIPEERQARIAIGGSRMLSQYRRALS